MSKTDDCRNDREAKNELKMNACWRELPTRTAIENYLSENSKETIKNFTYSGQSMVLVMYNQREFLCKNIDGPSTIKIH